MCGWRKKAGFDETGMIGHRVAGFVSISNNIGM